MTRSHKQAVVSLYFCISEKICQIFGEIVIKKAVEDMWDCDNLSIFAVGKAVIKREFLGIDMLLT